MKKVRGGSSSDEDTSAARGSGDTLPRNFFLFLTRSNMLFCPFEVSFTIIIGLIHVQHCKPLKTCINFGTERSFLGGLSPPAFEVRGARAPLPRGSYGHG